MNPSAAWSSTLVVFLAAPSHTPDFRGAWTFVPEKSTNFSGSGGSPPPGFPIRVIISQDAKMLVVDEWSNALGPSGRLEPTSHRTVSYTFDAPPGAQVRTTEGFIASANVAWDATRLVVTYASPSAFSTDPT